MEMAQGSDGQNRFTYGAEAYKAIFAEKEDATANGDSIKTLDELEKLVVCQWLATEPMKRKVHEWVDAALAANEAAANDVRSGKMAAIGRIVGAVMKLSGGKVDAKS